MKETGDLKNGTAAEALYGAGYRIADILPEQVRPDDKGQYAAVERYFLQPERLRELRARYARILMKMNGYFDLCLRTEPETEFQRNPAPEALESTLLTLSDGDRCRTLEAFFPGEDALATLDGGDTYMTFYGGTERAIRIFTALAQGEGLFVWGPGEG